MTRGITLKSKGHFGRGRESRKVLRCGSKTAVPQGRIPRISRLMALVIKFDQLIRDGAVAPTTHSCPGLGTSLRRG